MTLNELIAQAETAMTVVCGKPYPLRGAHVILTDGSKLGVALVIPQGRSRPLRAHYRANFYLNGKRITRDQAVALLS